MADHDDNVDDEHISDAERRRQIALDEFRELRGKYIHKYEGPDPAGERSEAIRRLLTLDDPYEGLTGVLMEDRRMSSGNLDIAALAGRRLRSLRGVNEREIDNPLCIAAADLVIEAMVSQLVFEAMVSQLVFEATLDSQGHELSVEPGSGPVRTLLAAAVERFGRRRRVRAVGDGAETLGASRPGGRATPGPGDVMVRQGAMRCPDILLVRRRRRPRRCRTG